MRAVRRGHRNRTAAGFFSYAKFSDTLRPYNTSYVARQSSRTIIIPVDVAKARQTRHVHILCDFFSPFRFARPSPAVASYRRWWFLRSPSLPGQWFLWQLTDDASSLRPVGSTQQTDARTRTLRQVPWHHLSADSTIRSGRAVDNTGRSPVPPSISWWKYHCRRSSSRHRTIINENVIVWYEDDVRPTRGVAARDSETRIESVSDSPNNWTEYYRTNAENPCAINMCIENPRDIIAYATIRFDSFYFQRAMCYTRLFILNRKPKPHWHSNIIIRKTYRGC